MKTSLTIVLALLIGMSCTTNRIPEYDLVITNVNIIDGTGTPVQQGANVYVKDRLIIKIDSGQASEIRNAIDGSEKFLIPGLFDCHVHTTDYNQDFPKLMHYGITSVFIPGGSTCTSEYYAEMRAMGSQDSIPAPRVFHTSQHFTIEGRHPVRTYSSSNWRENETVFFLKDTAQIARLVRQMTEYPILGIKITIEDGPAPPFVERMPQAFIDKTVEEASKYGLEVFAHVSDNEELRMAVEAGVQNLVHFTGVNIDWNNEEHQEVVEKLRMMDVSWVTTLMIDKSFLYPLHLEWFENEDMLPSYSIEKGRIDPGLQKRAEIYVKVLMDEYGIKENDLEAFMLPQVVDVITLYDTGINMVLGTDAGNDFNFYGYSLHEEMQLLQMGGMQPIDIIKMGTLNAAIMMHAQDSLGSIEVGKLADMILLDANPLEDIANTSAINTIYKGGKAQKRIQRD